MLIDPNFDEEKINEAILLPVGLREVIKLDGHPLYGSDKLNKRVGQAFGKSGRTKSITPKLVNLMDRKIVVPCFFTKGLIGYTLWKIFAPAGFKSIMAFYVSNTKKIYLLIQNDVNIFGYVANDFMGKLVVHELMHLIADQKKNAWFSMFKPELSDFYHYMWIHTFGLDDKTPKSETDPIMNWVFTKVESGDRGDTKSFLGTALPEYYRRLKGLEKYATSKESFNQILDLYMVAIKLFLQDINKFVYNYSRLKAVISPIYDSYRKVFNMKNLTTLCIQELIYPSEVIAIYSEDSGFNKPLNAIKAL
jgi:hypothetical protein